MIQNNWLKNFFWFAGSVYLLIVLFGLSGWVPPNFYWVHQEFHQDLPISANHLLGTGYFRKDIFSEFIYGTASTFIAGMTAAIPFLFFGVLFGISAGYFDNRWTVALNKILDVFNSFPKLLVLLMFIGVFGSSPVMIMALFGFISAPKLAELIKGRILSLKKETFIDASVALGLSHSQIISKHILYYNCKELILGQFFYIYGAAVLIEASLSYVRLGFSATQASWGYMLYEARSRTLFTLPWSKNFNMKALIIIVALSGLTLSMFYLAQYFKNRAYSEKGIV